MTQEIAQRQGTFLDKAIGNLEDMKVAAQMILDSKLAPDHFYEKTPDGKVDYTKGNVASVVLVCIHGDGLGMKPLVALQHIIPVNGLLSIKGDAAKSLIFNSGKLMPGTWSEKVTGSLNDGTYEVSITAQRADTKETMTRSFSVDKAKRAGLWIDEAKIRGQDGWKYQKSAWYKYPERMMTYRALGFLARDLFPDVLSGTYTTEEAMDIPTDSSLVVQTASGAEVIIPDPGFSGGRSQNLTQKAAQLIDKKNNLHPGNRTFEEAKQTADEEIKARMQYPVTEQEAYPPPAAQQEPVPEQKTIHEQGKEVIETVILNMNEKQLSEVETSVLQKTIENHYLLKTAMTMIPGKNTNKKLREIILAYQVSEDNLMEYIKKDNPSTNLPDPAPQPEPPVEEIPMEAVGNPEEDPQTDAGDDGNQFAIEIPDLVDGRRPFEAVKDLYEEMASVAGIDASMFVTMINEKFPQFLSYKSKEEFCAKASKEEINFLLNNL